MRIEQIPDQYDKPVQNKHDLEFFTPIEASISKLYTTFRQLLSLICYINTEIYKIMLHI